MAPSPASPPPAPQAPLDGGPAALPDGATLLALERRARHQGSGLGSAQLQGVWRFHQVWPRAGVQPQALAGQLLRALAAELVIQPEPTGAAGAALRLENRVRLGALELLFLGSGELRGRRPLLAFQFERMELRCAGVVLVSRRMAAPDPRRQPFFALVAAWRPTLPTAGPPPVGDARPWLAARGRGGGMALWCLAT